MQAISTEDLSHRRRIELPTREPSTHLLGSGLTCRRMPLPVSQRSQDLAVSLCAASRTSTGAERSRSKACRSLLGNGVDG
jgi:hypothetical protein